MVTRVNTSLEKHRPSLVALHSLDTAFQRLSLDQMLRQPVAASAELKGLLHLLKHLLVVAEGESWELSLNGRPVRHIRAQDPGLI